MGVMLLEVEVGAAGVTVGQEQIGEQLVTMGVLAVVFVVPIWSERVSSADTSDKATTTTTVLRSIIEGIRKVEKINGGQKKKQLKIGRAHV